VTDMPASPTPSSPSSPIRPRRSFGARVFRGLLLVAVLAAVGAALYTWASLRYVYSDGERAGYVQKFSRKGWVCKTWEGELAMVNLPGQPAELFEFTVRDEPVARQIEGAIGRRVALTYNYLPGLPSTCFGDTKYHVVAVKVVNEP